MLSIFPDFLTYSLFAPFILRVVLGLMFMWFGISEIRRNNNILLKTKVQLITKITLGFFLVIGLFTQAVAIILSLFTIDMIYKKTRREDENKNTLEFFVLVLAILISLIFLGAGFFAFDLPL